MGYSMDIMRQSACLFINPITVYNSGVLKSHDGGPGLTLDDDTA